MQALSQLSYGPNSENSVFRIVGNAGSVTSAGY
jgi:hypothetical protein